MSEGWDESAAAWIYAMGNNGDWGREHVLDPVMLERVSGRAYQSALDVGCGEGRFCRMLQRHNVATIGVDPTQPLIAKARELDPNGRYEVAGAEELPFENASFDLVVSYLTLIDIADFRQGLREMIRVLKPGGRILIANLNGFMSSRPHGWIKDENGGYLFYSVDRYLDEFPEWVEFSGLRVQNWHRPLSSYMKELVGADLKLSFFDEPEPRSGNIEKQARYRRAPWYLVMEWEHHGH